MIDWERKGYEAWVDLWVAHGYAPNATSCPARWMKNESPERAQFIAGWNRAKRESTALPAALAARPQLEAIDKAKPPLLTPSKENQ